jgi:ABC-2 type transport system ATP-binding protein
VLELIAGLRNKVTVFFSTHILTDVERICDRVAIIHKGELLLESGREELMNRYAVNAAELELDPACPAVDEFMASLQAQAWVESANRQQNLIRITVHDLAHGKQTLLPLAASWGLVVNRLEWVRPTLEEIFLKLSA